MSGTLVAGAGVAGTAAALALLRRGATVTVVDRASTPALVRLAAAGARVVVADEPPADLLDGVSDVVVSPGFAPHHPLAARAEATGYDVIAVELSSFQLHWSRTLAPQAGALLNLADDHLDWHGDFAAYAGA